MKVVRFVKSTGNLPITNYVSDEINAEGEYVSLVEYQELRQLLERVDKLGKSLADKVKYRQSPELTQLLSDIKGALK